MKKIFKKLLKVEKPFEQWALENAIVIGTKEKSEKQKVKKNKNVLRWVTSLMSILMVSLAIVLPFTLELEKKYTAMNTTSIEISLDELYEKSNNFLIFSRPQIIIISNFSSKPLACKDTPKNDNNLVLSYSMWNALIQTKDMQNLFWVDYRVRMEKRYEFAEYDSYIELKNEFEIGNEKVFYRIVPFAFENIAYLKFAYGNFEYYLSAKGFGSTVISAETLKLLINDLLLEINL